ncbi:MAG: DJ-1/PfpI family protein [Deltaproteobacteria bacterium]|nr:DJ-1/PfpI family protein [Deltaproteobacteria bacterium]
MPPPSRTLGVVLFPRFELLDVFGPLEMLGYVENLRITLVAESAGPVASTQGPRAVAEHALAEAPRFDVLLVPGGLGTRKEVDNAPLVDWIAARSAAAELVTTVCTGAALLARTGLLDGRRATTNKRAFAWVEEQGPRVEWVKHARWVEDGKFVTSSGVSAGIDMTLAVIERLYGTPVAEEIANRTEYERHRDPDWDPWAV